MSDSDRCQDKTRTDKRQNWGTPARSEASRRQTVGKNLGAALDVSNWRYSVGGLSAIGLGGAPAMLVNVKFSAVLIGVARAL
jgi:predicted phage tail protein